MTHKWDGITEFTAVVEQGNFTRAAQALSTSTAQISRHINQLEQRLNTKLLYRTTRKVTLTEEGQVFYNHSRHLVDGLQAAEQALSQLQQIPQGTIKLTAPVTYGERIILPILNDFLLAYPEIKLDVELTNNKLDLLQQGFDAAVRIGNLADSTMMAKPLTKRKNYLCASPDYLTRHTPPSRIEDLTDHNCLLGSNEQWRFADGDTIKTIKPVRRLRYNSGQGLVDAALKGLGIIQLPDYYVEPLIKQNQLVSLLDNLQIKNEPVWLLSPHNRQLSPKMKAFSQFLRNALA
ncbi:LysR family transcriptional regulator [Psychrosphaera ytuae]|uniref:LysR family transcriptional regulator n=1 Tax=Psychrosphaera ytuae TaxID=2820710 RepID=A0A975DAI7_9GAMM|nr:LysR substrate-binding domain-containing protein [Psychrosphaera ytuae]QTH63577.1 LysR family transcriptional regulator [Psychrosphaera ytuae]